MQLSPQLPRRTPNYRFSFVPLADVMFQLLVFFMLSSNFSAYSVLALRTGGVSVPGAAQAAEPSANAPAGFSQADVTAIWTLGTGGVIARGQQFALDQLDGLARATASQGTQNVVLVTRPDVRVQDIVRVLELLTHSGIRSVRIADGTLP